MSRLVGHISPWLRDNTQSAQRMQDWASNEPHPFFPQVRDGVDEWGWGVVVSVVKRPPRTANVIKNGSIPAPAENYIADTLLHCAPENGRGDRSRRPQPRPCPPGQDGEMQVIPVQLTRIIAIR